MVYIKVQTEKGWEVAGMYGSSRNAQPMARSLKAQGMNVKISRDASECVKPEPIIRFFDAGAASGYPGRKVSIPD